MPVEIQVPEMGESVVEATIARWLKKEGEPVSPGEGLVELETDKANLPLEASSAGVLERILKQEGETVHPNDVLGLIAPGDGTAVTAPGIEAAPEPPPTMSPLRGQASEATPTPADTHDGVRASPLAERIAEELHVDLALVTPTGQGGRVTREDVEAFAKGGGQGAEGQAATGKGEEGRERGEGRRAKGEEGRATGQAAAVAPPSARTPPPSALTPSPLPLRPEVRKRLSRRRLTIARRLVEAQQTAAMLTTFNEVDMSAVMAVRKRRREAFKERYGVGLGYMSFFTCAAVGALKAFPQVNSELQGDELVLKNYYDVGIAIGDPEGLVVPVVRDADRLTFAGIEQAIAAFVEKARNRALSVEDLRGGTFTITNGGVFGSLLSTPILNPPQVAILGMHTIQERPVVVNGEVVVRPMMYLALSYDHRVIDGREAVLFLVRIKELIEDPERLLIEA